MLSNVVLDERLLNDPTPAAMADCGDDGRMGEPGTVFVAVCVCKL